MEQEVTISRLPESVLDELEDEISKLDDEYDISPDIIRTLNLLIMGYHVAWDAFQDTVTPRSIAEWHEDIGDVLWWSFPIQEPPYCGSPLDSDWPDCHTHWTPITIPEEPENLILASITNIA